MEINKMEKTPLSEKRTEGQSYFGETLVYREEDVKEAVKKLKEGIKGFDMIFKLNLMNDMIDEIFGELAQ